MRNDRSYVKNITHKHSEGEVWTLLSIGYDDKL